MLFSNVIGQQEVKQHLVEMVIHNRLSHALLFLGKEGSGALPLALAFANFVCLNPTDKKTPEPTASLFGEALPANTPITITNAQEADNWMQQQPGYSKTSQMVHPDVHYAYPVITKKTGDKPISTDFVAEWREFVKQFAYGNSFDWLQFIGADNKQGNITAAECNDIIRKLSLKSFESPNKILVLWMPEYLDKEGNKLLKIIEEPPANTLFILVAETESQILPTILSRCQLVKIPALENNDIALALQQRASLNPAQAQQIAGIAEGNYREALQLIQHAEEDWQHLLREWLNALLKTGPAAQVKWIEEIAKQGREKQKQFLRYFNHLLQQSIRLRVINTPLQMLDNERDFAQRLNKLATIEQQQAIIEELDKAAYYIERNANAKMLFHALSIKLYHIIANKALILIN
jgi:DNA polymerase III subunit delta'